MQRFWVREVSRLIVGLLGAVVIAAAISAISAPHRAGLWPFFLAGVDRLVHFARLDLGPCAISGLPVLSELATRLPPTLILLLAGGVIAVAAGLPLGVLVSIGPTRRAAAPILQIITATPVFCAGLALAYGAVRLLHWPVSINAPAAAGLSQEEMLRIAALPIVTVGLAGAAAVHLALRHAAISSNEAGFRSGLKRLGLSTFEIERLFVLPHVLAKLIAGAGEIMLALLSATVVAEWVFHRPGAADLFIKSVALADWNTAAIILFVFAVLTIFTEFIGQAVGHLLANEGTP